MVPCGCIGIHSLAPPLDRYTIDSFLNSCFPPLNPLRPKGRPSEEFIFLMLSTGQATSSTFNIKLFTDALADYARITGIDLSTNPFARTLEQSDSLETILKLVRERETAFKNFRKKNRRLINYVSPCVEVLHGISGTLSEALSLPAVSYACRLVDFLM